MKMKEVYCGQFQSYLWFPMGVIDDVIMLYYYSIVMHTDALRRPMWCIIYTDHRFIESAWVSCLVIQKQNCRSPHCFFFIKHSLIHPCHHLVTHYSTLLCFSWLLHPMTRNKHLFPSFCLTRTTFVARHHTEKQSDTNSFQACFT